MSKFFKLIFGGRTKVIQWSFNGHSVVKLAKYNLMTGQKTEDGSRKYFSSDFGLRTSNWMTAKRMTTE